MACLGGQGAPSCDPFMFPGPGGGFKNFENRPMFDSAARADGGSWAVGCRLACLRAPWRFIAAKSCTKVRNSVELVRQGAQPRGSIGRSRAYPSRNRRKIRLNDAGLRIRWQYRLQRRVGDWRYTPKAEPYASLIESTRINDKPHRHSIWT